MAERAIHDLTVPGLDPTELADLQELGATLDIPKRVMLPVTVVQALLAQASRGLRREDTGMVQLDPGSFRFLVDLATRAASGG